MFLVVLAESLSALWCGLGHGHSGPLQACHLLIREKEKRENNGEMDEKHRGRHSTTQCDQVSDSL